MTDSEKLDLLLNKVIILESDVKEVKQEVAEVKEEVTDLKQEVEEVKEEVTGLNQNVTHIMLIIDNEVRVNIQRIAEGHLDLSRNLHEAMKPSKEVEMLAIKVNMLESEVRDSKHRVS